MHPFRFENPVFFLLLLALPLAFVIMRYSAKKAEKKFAEWGGIENIEKLTGSSLKASPAGYILLSLASVFLIIALANPQWGSKKETLKRKGTDVFLALDISKSMYAKDIEPNRMERAQQFARKLMGELQGNRIGLIIFAGNAYMQAPLTTDYNALEMLISNASPDLAPTQGTALGAVIDLAMRACENDAAAEQHRKSVIIITDGEDHEDDAESIAGEAAGKQISIFTVGVGTTQGAPIPVRDDNGNESYLKDNEGNTVQSKMNTEVLTSVAQAGGGEFYDMGNGNALKSLVSKIETLEKQEFEQRSFSTYESYFQIPLAIGLILLIAVIIFNYKNIPFWR